VPNACPADAPLDEPSGAAIRTSDDSRVAAIATKPRPGATRAVDEGELADARAGIAEACARLDRGDIPGATAGAMRAVSILREADAHDHLAAALAIAATAQAEAGNLDVALQLATESVALAQAGGDGRALVLACRAAGEVHGLVGQLAEGARLLGQALKASAPVEHGGEHAQILDALCRNALRQAERDPRPGAPSATDLIEDAIEHGRRGLDAARRVRNRHAEAACAGSLAQALLRHGDPGDALPLLQQARALAAENGFALLAHRIAALDGEARLACGDARAALAELSGLAVACERAGELLIEVDVQRALHRGARTVGDFPMALAAHERFHQLDARIRTEVAQTRARVLINAVETQNAQLEAEKARLEAELLRLKSRRLESEKRALEAQARLLDRHAHQDALTGLWNRRYIDDELPRLLTEAGTRDAPLTLAIGDIDLFKSINDKYGHPTGDAVLCAVADLLRDNCRPSDAVARVGGEEFLLVLEDTDPRGAGQVCERLRSAVEKHAWSGIAPDLVVTISFGISDRAAGADARDLLATADRHLYAAKNGGRNRVEPRLH
jgi:diguanylate cyclase (GGDEF)-like protein